MAGNSVLVKIPVPNISPMVPRRIFAALTASRRRRGARFFIANFADYAPRLDFNAAERSCSRRAIVARSQILIFSSTSC